MAEAFGSAIATRYRDLCPNALALLVLTSLRIWAHEPFSLSHVLVTLPYGEQPKFIYQDENFADSLLGL